MQTKTIEKAIEMNASAEKVWEVLTNDQMTRTWYEAFSAGTFAETDWKPGSKAVFRDQSGSGMVARVISNEPGKFLAVEYEGILINNEEDLESEDAKNIRGGRETYTLTRDNGSTRLSITCDMAPEYFDNMSACWDKALQKVKQLSESL